MQHTVFTQSDDGKCGSQWFKTQMWWCYSPSHSHVYQDNWYLWPWHVGLLAMSSQFCIECCIFSFYWSSTGWVVDTVFLMSIFKYSLSWVMASLAKWGSLSWDSQIGIPHLEMIPFIRILATLAAVWRLVENPPPTMTTCPPLQDSISCPLTVWAW